MIYEANAVPEAALTFLTRSRIQVILFYNIRYNVTIAANMCSQNSERATTTVSVSYGEGLPMHTINVH